MLNRIRSRLTYANVMASIAVFIALGAGAYAAGLAPNSVKSKHIVNGQVKSADAEDDGFTGTDIDEGSLGEVPAAADANELDGKDSAEFQSPGSEDWIPLPPVPGVVATHCRWTNSTAIAGAAGISYLRDRDGFVHLRGAVKATDGSNFACGAFGSDRQISGEIAQGFVALPAGYRPNVSEPFTVSSNNEPGRVTVTPGLIELENGHPAFADAEEWVSLDGISFRCGPSGQNGCP